MKFSIIHPTARVTRQQFPDGWWTAAHSAWRNCAAPREVQYILAVHVSRIGDFWLDFNPTALMGWGAWSVVVNYGRDCIVDQVNALVPFAVGDIFVGNQDDMRYPEHWDAEIAQALPDPRELACVQSMTNGTRRDLLTVPTICTRALAFAIGPISPEYDGMYSDDEWSYQARKLGRVIQSGLFFQHLHPAWGLAPMDAVHRMENRDEAYREGLNVLERRAAAGFPRVEGIPGWPAAGPAPLAVAPAAEKTGVLDAIGAGVRNVREFFTGAPDPETMPRPNRRVVACLPNENHQWIHALMSLQAGAVRKRIELFSLLGYTSDPEVTRMGLTESFLENFRGDKTTPYVLWLDDDNLMLPDQFERMVSFLDNNPLADIVVGWCWIKHGEGWSTSVGVFADGRPRVKWLTPAEFMEGNPEGEPKCYPGLASGFPCVLMRREVLERLDVDGFSKLPADEPGVRFGKLGEDFSFFWRAYQAGMRCYVDPLAKVGHIKPTLQEPDFILPPGVTELPPVLELMRAAVKGQRVELPVKVEVS